MAESEWFIALTANVIMTKKEKLILSVLEEGSEKINDLEESRQEMIEDYEKNGFGDMHPENIEGYKTGLHYTWGYCVGHKFLLEKITKLLSMNTKEIEEMIEEDKRISEENSKRLKKIFDDIHNRIFEKHEKKDGED